MPICLPHSHQNRLVTSVRSHSWYGVERFLSRKVSKHWTESFLVFTFIIWKSSRDFMTSWDFKRSPPPKKKIMVKYNFGYQQNLFEPRPWHPKVNESTGLWEAESGWRCFMRNLTVLQPKVRTHGGIQDRRLKSNPLWFFLRCAFVISKSGTIMRHPSHFHS